MFDVHAQKNILIVMLQIFDNLFHYKNIETVQWIKRLKLCMVTMATLPPAKELKIQVVSWQNEIRTLDVLKSPTCKIERSKVTDYAALTPPRFSPMDTKTNVHKARDTQTRDDRSSKEKFHASKHLFPRATVVLELPS